MSKENSEFRKESSLTTDFKVNDKSVDKKKTLFLEISDNYSIKEDCKLTSKSLMLKYLEVKFNEQDYFDTINTLNILFDSFSSEIEENSIVQVSFNQMTTKQLIKLSNPFFGNDLQKDEFDLTYEELIMFQIELIDEIVSQNKTYENIFILATIPLFTDLILHKINRLDGCCIIVDTNNYCESFKLKDIYLLEKNKLDLSDENQIYNFSMQHYLNFYTLEEGKNMIKEYIAKKYRINGMEINNKDIQNK